MSKIKNMVCNSMGSPKNMLLGERLQCNHSSKMRFPQSTSSKHPSIFFGNNLTNYELWKTLHKAQEAGKVLLFQPNNKEIPLAGAFARTER